MLFSIGVMFYEMLTGSRPFSGDSSAQIMSSILRDSPRAASALRPEVPDALSRLIDRCLEKRPEDRVQTARDVFNELRHVQRQSESTGQRTAARPSPGRCRGEWGAAGVRSTMDRRVAVHRQSR